MRKDLHSKANSKYAELLKKEAEKNKSYRVYLTDKGKVKKGVSAIKETKEVF